jgi:hypothetical protein
MKIFFWRFALMSAAVFSILTPVYVLTLLASAVESRYGLAPALIACCVGIALLMTGIITVIDYLEKKEFRS